MQCPGYDPGPDHHEKLRLKVTHTDRVGHSYIDLCLCVSPRTIHTLKQAQNVHVKCYNICVIVN